MPLTLVLFLTIWQVPVLNTLKATSVILAGLMAAAMVAAMVASQQVLFVAEGSGICTSYKKSLLTKQYNSSGRRKKS